MMDEVEVVARAIDPDAWADDVPTPTRGHVLDFHERRQRSCETARAAIAALDRFRGPSFMDVTLFDVGATHGREEGLREAAAWMKANAPVGMMEGDDYEREILALIDAKERVSANE